MAEKFRARKTSQRSDTQVRLSGYVCATRRRTAGQHGANGFRYAHATPLESLLSTLDRCHETDLPHGSTCNRLLCFHDVFL